MGDVWACRWPDISIHALLAESDNGFRVFYWLKVTISIHALLAESDVMVAPITPTYENISIHALLAESDHGFLYGLPKEHLFLSTLSLRRATT